MAILDSIASPADLRGLDSRELYTLAAEIRERIIATVSRNGGHLASNLGVVELTLALHSVFDSPKDMIVWDVGHQSYTHKLVTGRGADFDGLRVREGISGFPKRAESEHDAFDTGHASTSISAALGLLEAEVRLGREGKVIAVIGDGALTGGMAFEGLSHAGQLGLPLVVVLNDNKMSISPNVGALSRYLSRLSATSGYQAFRNRVDRIVKGIPLIGRWAYALMLRGKRAVKALVFKENLFSDLGFEYVGPLDGHNIPAMLHVFREVKALKRPVVIHVLTRKGKGFDQAEEDPARWHGVAPFACDDGTVEPKPAAASFTEAFSEAMLARACVDDRLVAVTAAMTKGTGLEPFRQAFPGRLYDVGIAEQHAVTFAAGLAAGGLRPVVAVYSTFMQRAVDQVFHDVALQGLPVTFAMDRSGPVGEDGETHQGLYDIALFRPFPNLSILAPASAAELRLCLDWAVGSGMPAMIRYPKARCPKETAAYSEPLVRGRGNFVRRSGSDTLLVAMGGLVSLAADAADELLLASPAGDGGGAGGRGADVYALRFIAPIDEEALLEAVAPYRRVILLEEGVAAGGVGEGIASLVARRLPRINIRVAGFPAMPSAQATREQLLDETGLSSAGIAARVRAAELEDASAGSRFYLFRAVGSGA